MRYLFPFDEITRDSRIILYGAGEVGRDYKRQIDLTNYCQVMLWVDRTYDNTEIFSLDAVTEFPENGYDCILLATNSRHFARQMRNFLLGKGIPTS